jgi:hypothetical protein
MLAFCIGQSAQRGQSGPSSQSGQNKIRPARVSLEWRFDPGDHNQPMHAAMSET